MLLIVYLFLCDRNAKQEPTSCFAKRYDSCGKENLALKNAYLMFLHKAAFSCVDGLNDISCQYKE